MAAKKIGKARVRAPRPDQNTPSSSGRFVIGVLSAGAPHSPLMAGALYAINEAQRTFNLIVTSGGGAIMGLLFMAPKGKTPAEGLRDVVEMGISDPIYRFFPLGYKTFFKQSPFTKLFAEFASHFKQPIHPREVGTELSESERRKRLYNDWVDLWFSAITPSSLTALSKGLCAPPPFLDELIDFRRANYIPPNSPLRGLVVNAYNIDRKDMDWFGTPNLNAAHLRAALAFPFIYPPADLSGHPYYEGATYEPLDFHVPDPLPGAKQTPTATPTIGLPGVDTLEEILGHYFTEGPISTLPFEFVVIDILGSLAPHLVRTPRNLWDAYGLSIMVPIVALAKRTSDAWGSSSRVNPITFKIPEARQAELLDWNYGNLCAMFDIGYEAGRCWLRDNAERLPRQPPVPPTH